MTICSVNDDSVKLTDVIARTRSLLSFCEGSRAYVTIGVFDGVHRGHQQLVTEMVALATSLLMVIGIARIAPLFLSIRRSEEALHQHVTELEARNEELDAFAHTAAHDLQNPLGLVIGYAEALEEDCATMPHEELRACLRTIAQGGRRMSNIVDELLLLAEVRKVEEVGMRTLDMASIVVRAQERLARIIEKHRAEIILPTAWPAALGHGPWVEEVWAN